MLNILSALSWLSSPRSGAYCAAKSAEWSLTNALRLELAPQGTRVTALHVGYMDTDMTRRLDVPKSDPAAIAKLAIDAIDAIEVGDAEIIADETSRSPDPPGEACSASLATPTRWTSSRSTRTRAVVRSIRSCAAACSCS